MLHGRAPIQTINGGHKHENGNGPQCGAGKLELVESKYLSLGVDMISILKITFRGSSQPIN